jgi:hypothetical protein
VEWKVGLDFFKHEHTLEKKEIYLKKKSERGKTEKRKETRRRIQ